MADDEEPIDAQVDIEDAIRTLLEATRSKATVNAALVTQLMISTRHNQRCKFKLRP